MGLRFRKSIKVAPGVKINLGKKSAGVSIGGKHGGVSFNTRSGARARVSAPGTGLSYSTKIGGGSNKSTASHSNTENGNTTTSSGNSNGGGCLITGLKILGTFILIPLVMLFGWIAGIIWLIVFRKKMADDPEKQKRYTIGVSLLSLISLIFMIYSFNTTPEAPTEPVQNEIVTDTEFNTEAEQEFDSEEIESTEFDTQAIETEQTEKESDADAELESDTEAYTDETPKSDETATSNSNTAVMQTPTNPQEQTQEQTPVEQQNVEQAQDQSSPSQETQSSVMVWVDDTAAKYHKKNGCGMDNAYQVTLEEAQAMGKEPCGRCYR